MKTIAVFGSSLPKPGDPDYSNAEAGTDWPRSEVENLRRSRRCFARAGRTRGLPLNVPSTRDNGPCRLTPIQVADRPRGRGPGVRLHGGSQRRSQVLQGGRARFAVRTEGRWPAGASRGFPGDAAAPPAPA